MRRRLGAALRFIYRAPFRAPIDAHDVKRCRAHASSLVQIQNGRLSTCPGVLSRRTLWISRADSGASPAAARLSLCSHGCRTLCTEGSGARDPGSDGPDTPDGTETPDSAGVVVDAERQMKDSAEDQIRASDESASALAAAGRGLVVQAVLKLDPTNPPVRKRKPKTNGQRHVEYLDLSLNHKGPFPLLTKRLVRTGGRNNSGRITVRHRGGGIKKYFREVDYDRRKFPHRPATVITIEFDPWRSAMIALVRYADMPEWADKYLEDVEAFKASIPEGHELCTSEYDPTTICDFDVNWDKDYKLSYDMRRLCEIPFEYAHTLGATRFAAGDQPLERNTSIGWDEDIDFEKEPSEEMMALMRRYKYKFKDRRMFRREVRNMIRYAPYLREEERWTYILCPSGLRVGQEIMSSRTERLDLNVGNAMPLSVIPQGTVIHNVEMMPGAGGKLCRAAGSSAMLMGEDLERKLSIVRLQSTEQRYVRSDCMATIGEVSNREHASMSLGKAGARRRLGWRPEVRGVSMNPNMHPHGGGEGHQGPGRPSVSVYGVLTKSGFKTRKRRKDRDPKKTMRINRRKTRLHP
ncbi:50S ribosomal protein L2 [Porphyridium purpureum]|uniref:50S ribosomal protein L2, chloroplastic n=1 Tax=Porphyridium purpureum TaxID=35688 RepID=A0A5J4Z1M5_PORPP|nr:50S ribosomal protein L2 [Porphyridium purpureum]|eukprot:POR0960..scf208_2